MTCIILSPRLGCIFCNIYTTKPPPFSDFVIEKSVHIMGSFPSNMWLHLTYIQVNIDLRTFIWQHLTWRTGKHRLKRLRRASVFSFLCVEQILVLFPVARKCLQGWFRSEWAKLSYSDSDSFCDILADVHDYAHPLIILIIHGFTIDLHSFNVGT